MKRASYKWLLLGSSLLIPAALVEASAGGLPSGRDTTQVTAEVISETADDSSVDLGLLGYLLNRKRTKDSEPAVLIAGVPEGYTGPFEEQGLIDILLGKKPQPLVIAAPIPVAKKPLPEPVEAPIPKGGLIDYLFSRGNTSPRPAASPAQTANRSQPGPATAKSSISTSQVLARSATTVESAAISDRQAPPGVEVKKAYNGPFEEQGLIDFLLGKEPQPLVIAAAVPVAKKPLPQPVEAPLPKGGLIDYLTNRGNTSRRPGARSARAESAAISADLLRIKVVLGQLPRSALASLEPFNRVARTPKTTNNAPLVENTGPQLELIQKLDSPGQATAVVVERTGLLELLLQRRPDAAGVEATKTASGDNNGN